MRNGFNVWKMAFAKAFLVAIITGFTTLQTSLNGITWEALNPTQQFLLVGGVVIAMATSLVAFLDRTISRIAEEQKQINPDPSPAPPTLT